MTKDGSMTPKQAEELAVRTLAAIDAGLDAGGRPWQWLVADRERVASDLAGVGVCDLLLDAAEVVDVASSRVEDLLDLLSAGLLRTAALYGVAPSRPPATAREQATDTP